MRFFSAPATTRVRRSTISSSGAATCTRRSRRCAPPTSISAPSRDCGPVAREAPAHRAQVRRADTGEPADDRLDGAQARSVPRHAAEIRPNPYYLKQQGPEPFGPGPLSGESLLLAADSVLRDYWPPAAEFSSA